MPIYYAGTGESDDFGTFILTIIIGLAILTLLTWGIPWFRKRLRLRREARLHAAEEQGKVQEGSIESYSEHDGDGSQWQSSLVK